MKQENFEFLIPKTFFVRAKECKLTQRETDVIEQLATGDTWKNAASNLGMSIRTLEKHVQRIHLKLGFSSTAQCYLFLLQTPRR